MAQETKEIPLIDPAILTKKTKKKTKAKAATAKSSAKPKKMPDKGGFIWGTGRRKSSVARVRIKPGKGKLQINKRKLDEYFKQPQDRNSVRAPLKALGITDSFDVFVNVKGGGTTGQAGAVM